MNKIEEKNFCTHIPVLLHEVMDNIPLKKAKVIIDCTVGLGGHAFAFVQKSSPKTLFIALDQDKNHIHIAKQRLNKFSNKCLFIHKNFINLLECARRSKIKHADIIFFDLGLASPHVDQSERGFSYKQTGPLDMRFDQTQNIHTASDLLNTLSEKDLKFIIKKYGEEKKANLIAKNIIIQRKQSPLTTTSDLKLIIHDLSNNAKEENQILKRVFQALRITVNNELENLEKTLYDAISLLNIHGRIAVISYHSLEDRIVKTIFKEFNSCHCPKQSPICTCTPKLKIITKKPIIPSLKEQKENPRSRSAKLRIAEKIAL